MKTAVRIIDALNQWMGRVVSYATILMAITMFAVVVLRYGFNLGWIAMQESITYMHAAVFLLGAAYTFQHNGHVRVDIFYRNFSPQKQALVNFSGALLFMLPFSIYITVACFDYVTESWRLREASMEPGGLPFIYLLKSLLLVFSISLALQAISDMMKQGLLILNSRDKQ